MLSMKYGRDSAIRIYYLACASPNFINHAMKGEKIYGTTTVRQIMMITTNTKE
jgi:hypothetical protein